VFGFALSPHCLLSRTPREHTEKEEEEKRKKGAWDVPDALTIKKPNLEKMASSHAMSGIDARIDVSAPLSTALPIPVNVSTTRLLLSKGVAFQVECAMCNKKKKNQPARQEEESPRTKLAGSLLCKIVCARSN